MEAEAEAEEEEEEEEEEEKEVDVDGDDDGVGQERGKKSMATIFFCAVIPSPCQRRFSALAISFSPKVVFDFDRFLVFFFFFFFFFKK